MEGILYGVGVGPGDPKLLTIQAVETLKNADIIAYPKAGKENTALNIVSEYIEGKTMLECYMPMTRDQKLLDDSHEACADMLIEELKSGKSIAFITLGDPSIYSTYIYVHKKVLAKGFKAQLIAGIPSFCAVAARLNDSLCEGKEPLLIVPASYEGLDQCLEFESNKVFMKSGKSIVELREKLRADGKLEKAKMVECATMKNEKVYEDLEHIDENSSYFSIIVVKE
ncbi:MAG: precorrin-2 C(20)-methyltransferase [Proteocatella sp.]